mgnify:CR=1 FL=1
MDSIFQGRIFEVVQDKNREFVRRAPGTRLIIHDKKAEKVLITHEMRYELGEGDYRLPGGKVFNTLVEYLDFLKSGRDIIEEAKKAAVLEARQEAGVLVDDIKFFAKSICGATVVWDLFYFIVDKFHLAEEQQLEEGETIEVNWVSLNEAKEIAISGRMKDERSAAVLLRYLHQFAVLK